VEETLTAAGKADLMGLGTLNPYKRGRKISPLGSSPGPVPVHYSTIAPSSGWNGSRPCASYQSNHDLDTVRRGCCEVMGRAESDHRPVIMAFSGLLPEHAA